MTNRKAPDDLTLFRLPADQAAHLQHKSRTSAPRRLTRQSGMFLKGPVTWLWLSRAGQLPGKVLHVAVVVHLLAGMRRGGPVSLSRARLRELGVDRHAAYRALRRLEEAGLVAVQRRRGRQPVVTILASETDQGRRHAPAL